MAKSIPLIDFQRYGLHVEREERVPSEELQQVGDEITNAFSSIGFCYIKNHGFPQHLVDKMFRISQQFFYLPRETKQLLARSDTVFHGWTAEEKEILITGKPGDLKESFDFNPKNNGKWPDSDLPEMESIFTEFYSTCKHLTLRILDVLSIGLKLEDRNFMRKYHESIGGNNGTSLRSLMYPPLPKDGSVKPGQQRCAEHTDYGTLTLLFQDEIGGLEVRNTQGEYIQATPITDAICVNIGDLMQRWTADRLCATKHRVVIPEEEFKKNKGRQSIAFFIHPGDDCVIECLDGSGKYEPVKEKDYLEWKFRQTYGSS